MGIKIANYKKSRATPAAEPTPPEAAPAAPVEAPAAPSGPTQAELDAAARRRDAAAKEAQRRRREAEEARRRDAAAAQEALGPQMVPYGDPATAAFIVKQAQQLEANPMYQASISLDKTLSRPIAPSPIRSYIYPKDVNTQKAPMREAVAGLPRVKAQTDYDIDVYRKSLARADLLKNIKPDPAIMANMPQTFKTDRGRQLYEASAKAAALKKVIDAKRLAPSFKLDQNMFEPSDLTLDDLNERLDSVTTPVLRPYDGNLQGLRAFDPSVSFVPNLVASVIGGAVDPGDSSSMLIPEDQLSKFMSPEQVEVEKIRRQNARIERLRDMPFEDIVAEVQGASSDSGR